MPSDHRVCMRVCVCVHVLWATRVRIPHRSAQSEEPLITVVHVTSATAELALLIAAAHISSVTAPAALNQPVHVTPGAATLAAVLEAGGGGGCATIPVNNTHATLSIKQQKEGYIIKALTMKHPVHTDRTSEGCI